MKCFRLLAIIFVFHSCSTTPERKMSKTFSSTECKSLDRVLDQVGISKNTFLKSDYISNDTRQRFTDLYGRLHSYDIDNLNKYGRIMCKEDSQYFVGKLHDAPFNNYRYDENGPDFIIVVDEKNKKSNHIMLKRVKPVVERFWKLTNKKNVNQQEELEKISLNEKSVVKMKYQYPSTKGMTKYDGKMERKKYLQDRIADIYAAILNLPKNHPELNDFLNDYFPGQLKRPQYMKIKGSIYKKLEKYQIRYNHKKILNSYSMMDSDHWYYEEGSTRGGIPDKQANLQSLLKEKKTRQELLGYMLLAESTINIKRLNKTTIEIEAIVNFPKVRAEYPFGKMNVVFQV